MNGVLIVLGILLVLWLYEFTKLELEHRRKLKYQELLKRIKKLEAWHDRHP